MPLADASGWIWLMLSPFLSAFVLVRCPPTADIDTGAVGKAAVVAGEEVNEGGNFGRFADTAHGNAARHVVDLLLC